MLLFPDITAGTGTESDETPGWCWPVGRRSRKQHTRGSFPSTGLFPSVRLLARNLASPRDKHQETAAGTPVRERWGCHHDYGRVSFRISNAQRGVESRSLHLNWFRSVTYLLISDSQIGGGCRGKNGSPFLRDKLPCLSVRFVPSGPSHRLAVSRDGDANDVDSFSVAFLGLLDGVLVNALHRDHGIAEIPFEGRFRSVQLGGVALPGRVGEVKRVAFQLHGKHERIL